MKFSLKTTPTGAEVCVDGKPIPAHHVAGIEFRAGEAAGVRIPLVTLTLVADEVDLDIHTAAVTQVRQEAPPAPAAPPAPPAPPNRSARRAASKAKPKK